MVIADDNFATIIGAVEEAEGFSIISERAARIYYRKFRRTATIFFWCFARFP